MAPVPLPLEKFLMKEQIRSKVVVFKVHPFLEAQVQELYINGGQRPMKTFFHPPKRFAIFTKAHIGECIMI
jgi:hypothetical protein